MQGVKSVTPGQIISTKIDIALANDITAPIAIEEFRKHGGNQVLDRDKIALVPDHFTPNKDIKSAEQCKVLRDFAKEQNITHYFDQSDVGVEHALLPEKGIVMPGDVVIGADSHTCTYGALGAFATGVGSTDIAYAYITGEAWFRVPETIKFIYTRVRFLPGWMAKTLSFTPSATSALKVPGIWQWNSPEKQSTSFPWPDGSPWPTWPLKQALKTASLFRTKKPKRTWKNGKPRDYVFYDSDPDATYAEVKEYDISNLSPQVAFPHLPENARSVNEIDTIPIDQVVIGSCTNGRIEDLRIAAKTSQGTNRGSRTCG